MSEYTTTDFTAFEEIWPWALNHRLEDGYADATLQHRFEGWQARQPEIDRWRARCIAAQNGHPQVKEALADAQAEIDRLRAELAATDRKYEESVDRVVEHVCEIDWLRSEVEALNIMIDELQRKE